MATSLDKAKVILSDLDSSRPAREDLYKEIHQNPELSLQEVQTAARIARELDSYGVPYSRVGATGLVAVLFNGDGPL